MTAEWRLAPIAPVASAVLSDSRSDPAGSWLSDARLATFCLPLAVSSPVLAGDLFVVNRTHQWRSDRHLDFLREGPCVSLGNCSRVNLAPRPPIATSR
jgi:hypothetical protein